MESHIVGYLTKAAVSSGFVREVGCDYVRVECHEDLSAWASARGWGHSTGEADTLLWRVDKEELISGLALSRSNLEFMFLPDVDDSAQSTKLRELVVDLREPTFDFERYILHHQTLYVRGFVCMFAWGRDFERNGDWRRKLAREIQVELCDCAP